MLELVHESIEDGDDLNMKFFFAFDKGLNR